MSKTAAFVVAGVASAIVYVLLGPGIAASAIYAGMGMLAAAAVLWGIRTHRPERKLPWLCLAVSIFLFALGDSIWSVYENILHQEVPFPSPADGAYLLGYPFLAATALLCIRGRTTGRLGIFVDTAIVALAAAIASWHFLLSPLLDDAIADPIVGGIAFGYPAADTVVLAAFVALLFTSAVNLPAFRLLLGGIGLFLFADIFYAVGLISETYTTGAWFDSAWILAYGLMGASALHPSMRVLVAAKEDDQAPLAIRFRFPVLGIATLAAVAMGVIAEPARTFEAVVELVAALVLPALVLVRLGIIFHEYANREHELEQSRDDLAQSQERYRLIVETAAEGIWLVDGDNRTLFANAALADMLGSPLEEMVGTSMFEFIRDEDRALAEGHIERRKLGITEQFEFPFVARDGRTVWTLISRKPLEKEGESPGSLLMLSDITNRKATEQAQRASEEQFRAVFEEANDAMLVADDGRRYVDANPAAEALLGRSREEILTMRIEDLIPTSETAVIKNWVAFLYSGRAEGSMTVTRPDDSTSEVEFSARANVLPGRHLSILRDVTERRGFETRLRQAEKTQAIGQLAGGIAHDFNNLLLAIRGYAELALMELDPNDGVAADIQEIKTAAERAAALTQQLLAFSRNQTLQPALVDLNHVLRNFHPVIRELLADDVELTMSLESELPRINVDRTGIEQVITSLVVNARDAMSAGGTLTFETATAILSAEESQALFGEERPGDLVCLTVSDTGSGMDEETSARAFEPFFTTKEQGKGTGLGLSTVEGMTSQSGGAVTLESRLGEGTTIRIYLPRASLAARTVEPETMLVEHCPLGCPRHRAAGGGRAGRPESRAWNAGAPGARSARGARRRRGAGARAQPPGCCRPADHRRRHAVDERPRAGRAPRGDRAEHPGPLHIWLHGRSRSAQRDSASGLRFPPQAVRHGLLASESPRAPRQESRMTTYPGTRVLVVDDTEQTRNLVSRVLERYGHACVVAGNAAEARARLAEEPFDLILCDVKMPGESGFDLAEHVLRAHPTTAVVMVTGVDDTESALRALELGAYGYVIKPFSINEILISVVNALRRRTLELDARNDVTKLEDAVGLRTEELKETLGSLHDAQEETVRRLSRVAEYRDDQTGDHIERVGVYCELLGRKLGLGPDECRLLRIASPLHDVGKVAIPDGILLKPGPLTPTERTIMERHAELGHEMLAGSGEELLDLAAVLALTHHEHFDGSGYPHGLAGHEIPIQGRIAAVADVFDALTSDRVYRRAFAVPDALAMLAQRRDTHFDGEIVDAFLASTEEVVALRLQYTESLKEAA